MENSQFENLDESLFEPMSQQEMGNAVGGGRTITITTQPNGRTYYTICNNYSCSSGWDA